MEKKPLFLSVVFVLRNREADLKFLLARATTTIAGLASEYEVIVVDNASDDRSVELLKELTTIDQLPNLQVYALSKPVADDIAAWAGLENCLGDFAVVIDLSESDESWVKPLLSAGAHGKDIVYGSFASIPKRGVAYTTALTLFKRTYQSLTGIRLTSNTSRSKMLSRNAINFVLRHPQPALTYANLKANPGFSTAVIDVPEPAAPVIGASFVNDVQRAVRLLVSTTEAPMRLVTSLSLFGAVANLAYSVYVLVIAMTKSDVAPGWASLSLQQSGMFFLISLVLLILGEYILHMASLSNEGPRYHVSQEFGSKNRSAEQLNVKSR